MSGWRTRHPWWTGATAPVHLPVRAQHTIEAGLAADVDALVGQRRHDPRGWGVGEAWFVCHFDDPRTLLFRQSMQGRRPDRVRSAVGACRAAAASPALKGSRINSGQRAGCFQPGAIGLSLLDVTDQGLATFQAGQALLDNLVGRGLDPSICRLFIVDGAKALTKAIRRTFGSHTPIQRCQVHKARNITERLPKAMQASVRRTLRQAWELDDADKAEKLIRNLARRLDHDAPGVRDSILEGLDEILTVNRLGLPAELRRSLACTNIIENMNGTVRRVCRNVKHWRDAAMALRWTGAAMMEAAKGFRRLKAHRQLPILKAALAAHGAKHAISPVLERQSAAA